VSNGFRRALLDLSPDARAVCESPLLPFVARACGACDTDQGHDPDDLGRVNVPERGSLFHHVHIDRHDLAVFEEDPDERPYIWDLEESCSCH